MYLTGEFKVIEVTNPKKNRWGITLGETIKLQYCALPSGRFSDEFKIFRDHPDGSISEITFVGKEHFLGIFRDTAKRGPSRFWDRSVFSVEQVNKDYNSIRTSHSSVDRSNW